MVFPLPKPPNTVPPAVAPKLALLPGVLDKDPKPPVVEDAVVFPLNPTPPPKDEVVDPKGLEIVFVPPLDPNPPPELMGEPNADIPPRAEEEPKDAIGAEEVVLFPKGAEPRVLVAPNPLGIDPKALCVEEEDDMVAVLEERPKAEGSMLYFFARFRKSCSSLPWYLARSLSTSEILVGLRLW